MMLYASPVSYLMPVVRGLIAGDWGPLYRKTVMFWLGRERLSLRGMVGGSEGEVLRRE